MTDGQWAITRALWKREGWAVIATPDLHQTYDPDYGFVDAEGVRLALVRGLDRVEVYADTERKARVMLFEKMEG